MPTENSSIVSAASETVLGNVAPVRFFALDCVRATAMTLGVLYHALLFGGGVMMMGGGSPTFASRLMDWIHSFRMPLFFLISGFFSHMMLIKYGWGRYFLRRYWRIAVPLFIVIFALGGIRAWTGGGGFAGGGPGPTGGTAEFRPPAATGAQPAGFPGFPPGGRSSGPGAVPPGAGSGGGLGARAAGDSSASAVAGTKDPGLFASEHWGMDAFACEVPNGKYLAKLYFAETYAGISAPGQRVFSLNVQGHEFKDFDIWAKAGGFRRAYVETVPVEVTNGRLRVTFLAQSENPTINAIEIIPQPGLAIGAASAAVAIRIKAGQTTAFTDSTGQVWEGDRGFEGGSLSQALGGPGFGGFSAGGFPGGEIPAGGLPGGGPRFGAGGSMPDFFGGGNSVSARIFGGFSRNLNLQHLWFLCYLLIFATLAPAVAAMFWWALERTRLAGPIQRLAPWGMRWGLAPLVLALISLLGLLISGTSPGRPPGGYATIMGQFPDVFLRYDRDWAYFFLYFLGGWGLYALRDRLDDVARIWLPTLATGFGAYIASVALAGAGPGFFMPPQPFDLPAFGRHLLFAIAVTGTSFGIMGFFHRYFNRPTWAGRYLADTAFWVYIVHQDLMNMVVLRWVRPWNLSPLLQALATVAITTAIALVVFELVIRPTPLTSLFGPPRRKHRPAAPVAPTSTETAPT